MKTKHLRFIDKIIGNCLCLILWPFKTHKMIKEPKKILIVRLWAIGESILTLPMIDALKKKFPKAKIDILINNSPYQQIFYQNKNINKLVYFSPFVLLKHFKKYDLAIDTEPFFNISAISSFMLAKKSIGFNKKLRSLLYNIKINYNDKHHVVETYMDMLRPFNIYKKPKKLIKLKYPQSAKIKIKKLLEQNDIKKSDFTVGFFAGASQNDPSRRWPEKNFAQIADYLISKKQAKIILLGLHSEQILNQNIKKLTKNKKQITDLTGKTKLPETFALIEKFNLFISNDSGPMHISAAQGTKTIGLFGPNTPLRFGPYGPRNIGIRKETMKPCINVHLGQITQCKHKHMEKIKIKHVIKAINEVLPEFKKTLQISSKGGKLK
ncbi:MAG: glycosyltransferase family 9 protein [Nanoarchaeota archaeon]|nr:glycosyltransferase family 9 protein [Nanoarchaeota archaeon]